MKIYSEKRIGKSIKIEEIQGSTEQIIIRDDEKYVHRRFLRPLKRDPAVMPDESHN